MKGDSSDDDNASYGRGARCRRKQSAKSRRELPAGAVATLRAWMLSPEHFTHPYPTPQDQVVLMQKTGIDKKQLKNWFTNARRRIWKPLLEKQREQQREMGIEPTAAGPPGNGGGGGEPFGGGGAQVAPMPPLATEPSDGAKPYQQALQDPQPGYGNSYGAPPYSPLVSQQQQQQSPSPEHNATSSSSYHPPPDPMQMVQSNSIGSLPPVSSSSGISSSEYNNGAGPPMSKTDSQAMLMELFQRDQDLVRQATEGARLKAQAQAETSKQQQQQPAHPLSSAGGKNGSNPSFVGSWPHFSSVSSLNNLGTLTGVKSITSMNGGAAAGGGGGGDHPMAGAGQGTGNSSTSNLNLVKVKSIESMGGRTDSMALFMGVFFDDCIDPAAAAAEAQQKGNGMKRDRDEDNDVGLSLDAEAPFKRKPASVAFGA